MKKIVLITLMLGFLFACSSNDTNTDTSQNNNANNQNTSEEQVDKNANGNETSNNNENNAGDTEENVKVDKNLLSVEVTLPPSLVGTEEEEIENNIKEAEAENMEVEKNDDGSLTYKMSKSKHKDMMDELKTEVDQSIQELTDSGDFPSIHAIEANDTFSEFEVEADQEAFENSMDGFALLGIGVSGMMYQLFDGVAEDDYDVEIEIKNKDTKEVFDTVNYPEDMEDANME